MPTDSSTTVEHRDVRGEILSLVDSTIGQIANRDLVSTSEMTDLLLDIRLMLMLTVPFLLLSEVV